MAETPVPHPCFPVLAERGGAQLNTPRATVLVDTRERKPFDLVRFGGLVCCSGEKSPQNSATDSIAGLEEVDFRPQSISA